MSYASIPSVSCHMFEKIVFYLNVGHGEMDGQAKEDFLVVR